MEDNEQHFTFPYTYGRVNHLQDNIAEASTPYIMGDPSWLSFQRRDVSVVYNTSPNPLSEEISRQHPYQHQCDPSNLNFNRGETPRSVTVAIGEKSTPLFEWIRNAVNKTGVWLYFLPSNELRGVLPNIRKVGRWIGEAFHKRHMEGDFLGQYLEKLSVREDKITFEHVYKSQHTDLIQGIKDDILQFGEFIKALATKPYKPTKSGVRQDPEHTAIISLALDLCAQVNSLSTLDALQDLSYFVSHIPLFWESSQRHDFVDAFKRIMDKFDSKFQKVERLIFTGKNYIDPKWSSVVLENSIGRPYKAVYNKHMAKYRTSMSLFLYQRSCYIHFKDASSTTTSVETITSNLHRMFPSAIPKAWNGLYEHILSEVPTLVKELKCQPTSLY